MQSRTSSTSCDGDGDDDGPPIQIRSARGPLNRTGGWRRLARHLCAAVVIAGCDSEPEPHASAASTALETQAAVTFTYDALGRLKIVEYPNATKRIVHNLDAAGNRTQRIIDQTISQAAPPVPVWR